MASPPREPTDSVIESPRSRMWRYARALAVPLLIWLLLVGALIQPVLGWLHSEERYDQAAVQEWIEEARNADSTLADLVARYKSRVERYASLHRNPIAPNGLLDALDAEVKVAVSREEIYQQLRSLGDPLTKMYPGQLVLFPLIYRMEVHFDATGIDLGQLPADLSPTKPVIWDSGLEPSSGQGRCSWFPLGKHGEVMIRYQLRAWNKRQRDEEEKGARLRQLGLLALAATALAVAWLTLLYTDENDRQRQARLARESLQRAERQRVQSERQLLEQKLATQAAEQKTLELRSHLYASIGIMAGSYAHNIKNLLVRPNDLLRRCLDRPNIPDEEQRMLHEVQQTLGMVTERLHQILQTVRRDPSQSRLSRLDLNALIRNLTQTWSQLAAQRWQMDLQTDLAPEPLYVAADDSHLQQAIENLLFNARDATFEMRSHHRDLARKVTDLTIRKTALLGAASWRGQVLLRTRQDGSHVLLEVTDNGAGMTDEVRQSCTQTHFSTKRDNALYEGHSTGMGLGLSFVVSILENHQGHLEIESRRLEGTTFRLRFPHQIEQPS